MRERKFIEPFSPELLTQGASFQFQEDVYQAIANAPTFDKILTRIDKDLQEWQDAFNVFDAKLKLSQKSLTTDEIKKADEERDAAYRQYRRAVKAFLDFPIAEKAEAAKILWQNLKDYNIQTGWELTRQTGMTKNLLQDVKGKNGNYVKALGLETVVERLENANKKVALLISDRNEEKAGRIVGETREARRESERLYKALVEVINAYSLIEGPADYTYIIDQVNADIKRLKLTLPSRSKKDTDTHPVEPENTEQGE